MISRSEDNDNFTILQSILNKNQQISDVQAQYDSHNMHSCSLNYFEAAKLVQVTNTTNTPVSLSTRLQD